MAGSLPKEVILRWVEERDLILNKLQKQDFSNDTQRKEAIKNEQKRSFARFDSLLDNTIPTAHRLDRPEIAKHIIKPIHWHEQNGNLQALCYCIMPNHVHLVVVPIKADKPFFDLIRSIKTYSAKHINQHLNRKGTFWQREYYDHVVRDGAEIKRIISYVLENPVKAGLCKTWNEWPFSWRS